MLVGTGMPDAAKVEGVSVALPRTVMIHGRPVETSILREPSKSPIHFGETGPENNATAVHSEHVLISPVEMLRYWHDRLKREGECWGPGYWGENLTIAGLPDELEMRIGTVLQVGPSARLEIVGPRVPCYKLMWRIGMPDDFIREMMLDGRVGYYARVLHTGSVTAGDRVEVVSIPDHDMTTARLARQLAPNASGDLEALQFALSLPAIGRQAAGGIRRKLSQILDGMRCTPNRWTGWRDFRVARKQAHSDDVLSFWFEAADGGDIAAFRGGQHVAVRLPSGLTRNWTLSDFDELPKQYRISVRKIAGGRGSAELHGLAVDDKVSLRAPSGQFFMDPAGLDRNVLISAGIGITPMLSMLKARIHRRAGPPTVWVHSTRDGESYVYRDEVDELLAAADDVTAFVAYSRPSKSDRLNVDFHHAGRLTSTEIGRLTEPYPLRFAGKTSLAPGTESIFYVCGPAEFEDMVRTTLLQAGVPDHQIHSEQFGPAGTRTAFAGPSDATIHFARSGVSAHWSADDPVSLLDLAEQAGLSPDFDCRSGECHRCLTRLLKGEIAYPLQPLVPAKEDEVLICCARPASRELTLAL